MENNKVSCLCITYKRVSFLVKSIDYFNSQTHDNKEFIIVYQDNDEETENFIKSSNKFNLAEFDKHEFNYSVKHESNITFLKVSKELSLGRKRNLSIQYATGDYVCIWDDDDFFPPNRIESQLDFLIYAEKPACTLSNLTLFLAEENKYFYSSHRNTGWEGSLLCKTNEIGKYHDLNKKEDTPVIDELLGSNNLAIMESPELYVYRLHGNNVSGKKHFEELLNYALEIN